MITVTTVAELRARCDAARRDGARVGFVPTMGSFHEGHRSLMRAARAANDVVVVSLFVNPTQFGPNEDLTRYPRDPEGDSAVAECEGVDMLFVPSVDEMYPDGSSTSVHVEGLTTGLCGASRPGHFDGVTTVVAKLFSMVGPCRAYFGRKDAQQLAVIRRMTTDLALPVEVVGCPLVREPDGLAMSSRNAFLADDDRQTATVLSAALRAVGEAVVAGERDAQALRRVVVDMIDAVPEVRLDYAEVVDAHTLVSSPTIGEHTLIAVAAFVGSTRLIDNVTITVRSSGAGTGAGETVTVDTGVITPAFTDRALTDQPSTDRASADPQLAAAAAEVAIS